MLERAGGAQQPGYRAALYDTVWPADMADLNRSNTVVNAGLPRGVTSAQVRVDTVEMPFPVFAYTRNLDQVFVVGGVPDVLEDYVAAIDGARAGSSPNEPHLTRYTPSTGETARVELNRGSGFAYIGGALMHANGYVYVVSQAYLYKVHPDSMTIVAGTALPLAPFPGNFATIYNGLSASRSGRLLTKYFSPLSDASLFLVIDPDTLEIVGRTEYPGASPRLSVSAIAGEEFLYHLNRRSTFRFRVSSDSLVLDERWISRFDPAGTGQEENAEPTSPVVVGGRVHYTTNTQRDVTEPMRIFWQETATRSSLDDPPLAGEPLLSGAEGPGWSFFHLAVDDVSGIIVGMDQGAGALVAVRVGESGALERLWQRNYKVSARPVIVSDRRLVYATDYAEGRNHLVAVDLKTGEELLRVATPATRPTIATIVVSAANEVYFGSNEPGAKTGLFHRFHVP
ncbi:MAG: hypothetical protein SFW67_03545 [Myxococcaceae bacterium]|nr:hypothetical protein [Myxococcaceae bacterium]